MDEHDELCTFGIHGRRLFAHVNAVSCDGMSERLRQHVKIVLRIALRQW